MFNKYYKEKLGKWDTMEALGMSERTFGRRKRELIYQVHKELNHTKEY